VNSDVCYPTEFEPGYYLGEKHALFAEIVEIKVQFLKKARG